MPTAPRGPSPLHRWGGLMARHRAVVLAVWALLVAASAVFYPSVESRLAAPDYTVQSSESATAQKLMERHFPATGAEQGVVVFRSARLRADAPAYRSAVERVLAVVPADAGGPADPYSADGRISADGHVVVATFPLTGDRSARADRAGDLQRRIRAEAASGPVEAYLTGPSALTDDLSDVELRDQSVAESVGVPIALLALLLAFGAAVAALLPVATALGSVLVGTAVLGLLAGPLHLDRFVTVVATVIGIGVGIDYGLFVISRFREELARRTPREGTSPDGTPRGGTPRDGTPRDGTPCPDAAAVRESVGVALRTSGRTVLTAGLIVVVALGSMILIRGHIFTEIAVASGLMVVLCLLTSLTALPALLALLGHRVDGGALPRRLRPAGGGRWAAWARTVLRHPYRLGLPVLALLAAMALPLSSVRLGVDWGLASLTGTPSGKGQRIAAASFSPGAVGPVQVVACGPGDTAVTGARHLADAVRNDKRVTQVLPVERSGGCASLRLVLAERVDSPRATAFVRDLRSGPARTAFATSTAKAHVGGLSAEYVDLADETAGKLPLVVLVILALSFCYLLVVFRSVLVPLKAVLLNLAATTASLGVTTLVFQRGWGEGLFGFTSSGTLQAYLPVALFALLFGLSMDYEIFLVGRIQEERLRTGDDARAIPAGLEHTARQITTAASIMVIVFGSLLFARVLELKQFGFGLAFAVLLDATVVRLLLVPAVMGVAGRANWWLPGWLERRLPAVWHE
ncbi:MMPL family transporter [Streptomyces sp. UNOC14_S4]|uniref:MMPL family transporter n=1 Tax=Streptomyces sp. UNOC14_S4 TaxID=2872340 RepID=UPI001E3A2712|nr:MMPL family transporter [Streptomyces sp. UNOC14_S4]MCC3769314.1 MMPL family transporter [Streptomyces sp. UNOC14_S4]